MAAPAGTATAAGALFRSRTVPFAFHGLRLRFDLASTVFASAGVDPGSALLLRHLQSIELPPAARVLDLGCGHGVLGLVLLALDPRRHVTLVDRDALACEYTARNLALNRLPAPNSTIGGSLGYDDLPTGPPFDLIVSNLPGKAGESVLAHLVTGPGPWSRPGTVLGLVVVSPLAALVRDQLSSSRCDVLVDRATKAHQVFIARFRGPTEPGPNRLVSLPATAFDTGRYDRSQVELGIGDLRWRARTVNGLDEFDSLSHATALLRGALRGVRAGTCTVLNPGQGHRALVAARSGQHVGHLVSRDLLALRATRRLLGDNGLADRSGAAESVHALSPPAGDHATTLIVHAEDKVHSPWLVHEVEAWLGRTPGPDVSSGADRHLVLSGRAGVLGRIEVDILARTAGRLAYKQNRDGYRVIRYQFRA